MHSLGVYVREHTMPPADEFSHPKGSLQITLCDKDPLNLW